MNTKKPSLLDRLTSAVGADDPYDDLFDVGEEHDTADANHRSQEPKKLTPKKQNTIISDETEDWDNDGHVEDNGDLALDVYQTNNDVVVKALVAGVLPSNLEILLTRDMLTIKGTREEEREVEDENYFHSELYWGSFSRTILLPEEVDVDAAEAVEKHGILMIRMPKVNKKKATKLKVKTR